MSTTQRKGGQPVDEFVHQHFTPWWNSLIAPIASHPLKALAIKIFSIVPHAAEVERFFSCLGGVQSARQSRLTVSHMQTFGTLRNQYTYEIHQAMLERGKSTCRKHAHMHTQKDPGIDLSRAEDLIKTFLWTPLDTSSEGVEPESITVEDIDAEFERLEEQGEVSRQDKIIGGSLDDSKT